MRVRQLPLYLLVLTLVSFVGVSALGGGLFHQQEHWILQWQHQLFSFVCHQEPSRSFWLSGQPMAVCSRCLGIYVSFWIGWAILPFLSRLPLPVAKVKVIVAVLIIINIADVTGNVFEVWQNSLYSRLILGGLTGFTTVLLFTSDFFNLKPQ